MPHENLGLFDTPPSRGENQLALGVVAAVFLGFLAVIPEIRIPLGEAPAFIPTISAILFFGELIIASLLYAQAALFRSRALTVLAAGHVLTALLLIPYALSFPGAFSPGGLLDPGMNTTAWLIVFRRFAFPITILLYAWLKRRDESTGPEVERPAPRVLTSAAAAAAIALALTLMATVGHDWLPPLFSTRTLAIGASMVAFNGVMIVLLGAAFAMLLRKRSVLDTWLLVSVATLIIQCVLNALVPGRFTVGFYGLFLLMLVSHLVMLLALIAESNRLYLRLALSTAQRNRERDTRMMSMEGVAAAISHEVGQPLAAVSLGASSALSALTRKDPDTETAIQSLRNTVEGAQRAFAVVKSIRAMFGKSASGQSQFDLNELVRESAALLDREMASQGISLRLALDEALPPVVANRVQIQRVLINLMTNAIESLADTTRRVRRIAIGTATFEREMLRVEVSDNGAGFAPEALANIFDPFFTTKSSGTGLGLSLSRTIVEDHGGRLWASQGLDGGAVFHLELRTAPAQAA